MLQHQQDTVRVFKFKIHATNKWILTLDLAKLEPFVELDTEYRSIHWNTEYSRNNRSESDVLWDAILPSHGFVAMDRDAIKAQGWPESMYLPSDKGKGVYLLEAYHHIHCLVRISFYHPFKPNNYL